MQAGATGLFEVNVDASLPNEGYKLDITKRRCHY